MDDSAQYSFDDSDRGADHDSEPLSADQERLESWLRQAAPRSPAFRFEELQLELQAVQRRAALGHEQPVLLRGRYAKPLLAATWLSGAIVGAAAAVLIVWLTAPTLEATRTITLVADAIDGHTEPSSPAYPQGHGQEHDLPSQFNALPTAVVDLDAILNDSQRWRKLVLHQSNSKTLPSRPSNQQLQNQALSVGIIQVPPGQEMQMSRYQLRSQMIEELNEVQ
ncbi:MAG: hypothetical protein KDB22_19625 [Planctomycetales bacterium]|nr:hypothetical protein [Planctomycetales bacterium]